MTSILRIIDLKRDLVKKHLARYDADESTGCWVWSGPVRRSATASGNPKPYGVVSFKAPDMRSLKIPVHRLSLAYHLNIEPTDLLVRHKCNNTLCINPDHLGTGTHQDNVNDRKKEGGVVNQYDERYVA